MTMIEGKPIVETVFLLTHYLFKSFKLLVVHVQSYNHTLLLVHIRHILVENAYILARILCFCDLVSIRQTACIVFFLYIPTLVASRRLVGDRLQTWNGCKTSYTSRCLTAVVCTTSPVENIVICIRVFLRISAFYDPLSLHYPYNMVAWFILTSVTLLYILYMRCVFWGQPIRDWVGGWFFHFIDNSKYM